MVSALVILGAVIFTVKSQPSYQETRYADDPKLWYSQYPNKIVQSDSEVCNDIGVSMFQKNGTAADAAIATAICIGVVLNCDSGLGGGMFLTHSNDETNEIYRLNARETAPINSFKDMYVADPSSAVKGGLSIAVPGAVKGYQEFHEKHGQIAWKELWQPSIELALNGYPLTEFF